MTAPARRARARRRAAARRLHRRQRRARGRRPRPRRRPARVRRTASRRPRPPCRSRRETAPATGSTTTRPSRRPSSVAPSPCARRHTSMTFAVGPLDAVVDGHLLAVDSERVRDQVATSLPGALRRLRGRHDGGPAAQHAAAGLVHPDRRGVRRRRVLVPLRRRRAGRRREARPAHAAASQGVLGTPGRPRPLRHVRHRRARHRRASSGSSARPTHSWRAVATVPFDGRHATPASRRSAPPARPPARTPAPAPPTDALDYQWGYEWPTAEQWRAGQTYGLCWAPD